MRLSSRSLATLAPFAVAGTLTVAVPAQTQAQTDAARTMSEDATALFGHLCVSTRGNAQRIDRAIAQQRIQAVPLSEDGVRTLLEGEPGDRGWLVRSERGTAVQLHLREPTTCNVRAMDTDDAVVNDVLTALLEALSASEKFTMEKVVDERRQTNGGEEHLVGYRLFWAEAGWTANLGVSHIAGDGADIPPQVNFMLALKQSI